MDVTCRRVERITHQQIHVTHNRRLVGNFANIGGRSVIILDGGPSKLNCAIRRRTEPFDHAIDYVVGDFLSANCRASVGNGQLAQGVADNTGGCSNEQGCIVGPTKGTHTMVEQILATESSGERDGGLGVGWHRNLLGKSAATPG